ncbi:MAG TPA: acetate--CoA ligase family protein [Actinomycetes bacterium]|nr:acetate--CoA ligase family protein [Actinomycetes bacterium]
MLTTAARPEGLAAVFAPRRIALVGASDRQGGMGSLFWANLSSFPGEVVPVTRSAATVGGRPTYPSLRAVEGPIDLAVVVVPAAAVPQVIADAGAAGIAAAIVVSGGFAETGQEGRRRQEELVAAARAGGVRVVGPNCFGVQNCDLPLNASLAAGLPPGGGGISLLTQSGAYGMAAHVLGVDERARFAKVYAPGNRADLGDAEVLAYLRDDPATRVVCCYLESLPAGRAFVEEAARITPVKPVLVCRTGRSAAGARAARSHTAALAGRDRVAAAALEQAGVVETRSGMELLDAARALDHQPRPGGGRVAVVTNSGGTGVELADLLAAEGLEVPELSAALQADLVRELPAGGSARNPVDVTPAWSRFATLYPLLVERLARSGEVDLVLPVLLQRSAADARVAEALRSAVARLRADGVGVPVHVCWVAPRSARPNADLLQEAGIPCFEWPDRAARAAGHARRAATARERVRACLPALARHAAARPPMAPPGPLRSLDPERGAALLHEVGIATAATRVCASVEAAAVAAEKLGFPVVAKVVHPELSHKSDAGGVRTGLAGAAAVRSAAAALLALVPGARVLVQRQVGGVEVAIGGLRDPQFGPVIMVGLGGVMVEVLDDVGFALAPLDVEQALRRLHALRGWPVLAGVRGALPVDATALARTIVAVGDLVVAHPEIAELDLNPVFASAGGAVTADWRILTHHA